MSDKPVVIRYISRQIVASSTHCSNDCPGMTPTGSCGYFKQPLTWDTKKHKHGFLRLLDCKNRELNLRDE